MNECKMFPAPMIAKSGDVIDGKGTVWFTHGSNVLVVQKSKLRWRAIRKARGNLCKSKTPVIYIPQEAVGVVIQNLMVFA